MLAAWVAHDVLHLRQRSGGIGVAGGGGEGGKLRHGRHCPHLVWHLAYGFDCSASARVCSHVVACTASIGSDRPWP